MVDYKPTKTFLSTLEFLGKDYTSKVIDGELCGYIKLNDCYDIEISGMNNNKVKNPKFYIYVWDTNNKTVIADKVTVDNLKDLKSTLNSLRLQYSKLPELE